MSLRLFTSSKHLAGAEDLADKWVCVGMHAVQATGVPDTR